ncbi:hypothetical protein CAOG_001694 [Capsaspora owczarzaki ATCC 30864]|uniref:MINDY deubiquitinase domain-containing protein n=1 Tax=Capsaspora owczarzaki (strain ATCC 30864) TaxID=595528 RepID=A0A0D2X185_CAPO3|nr:hypothetical protein CAOG_001694 [Capsaspora owczarzaki ATCC 30864]
MTVNFDDDLQAADKADLQDVLALRAAMALSLADPQSQPQPQPQPQQAKVSAAAPPREVEAQIQSQAAQTDDAVVVNNTATATADASSIPTAPTTAATTADTATTTTAATIEATPAAGIEHAQAPPALSPSTSTGGGLSTAPPLGPSVSSASTSNAASARVDDVYVVKRVPFRGREQVGVVTQNRNGPCPLLAICNVLLLAGRIHIHPDMRVVTYEYLCTLLGDEIMRSTSKRVLNPDARLDLERNVADCIAVFPRLQTGLDVNVRFTGIADFEFTQECLVFDLLGIPLYHGWIVDPSDTAAVSNKTYNQLIVDNPTPEQTASMHRGLAVEAFLNESPTQLTEHGVRELSRLIKPGELAVFFRNNHFGTIFKRDHLLDEPLNQHLVGSPDFEPVLLLLTDQGYVDTPVAWETLTSVAGDGSLLNARFANAVSESQAQEERDLAAALALSQSEQNHTASEAPAANADADFLLAMSLQKQEDNLAAQTAVHLRASRSNDVALDAE